MIYVHILFNSWFLLNLWIKIKFVKMTLILFCFNAVTGNTTVKVELVSMAKTGLSLLYSKIARSSSLLVLRQLTSLQRINRTGNAWLTKVYLCTLQLVVLMVQPQVLHAGFVYVKKMIFRFCRGVLCVSVIVYALPKCSWICVGPPPKTAMCQSPAHESAVKTGCAVHGPETIIL